MQAANALQQHFPGVPVALENYPPTPLNVSGMAGAAEPDHGSLPGTVGCRPLDACSPAHLPASLPASLQAALAQALFVAQLAVVAVAMAGRAAEPYLARLGITLPPETWLAMQEKKTAICMGAWFIGEPARQAGSARALEPAPSVPGRRARRLLPTRVRRSRCRSVDPCINQPLFTALISLAPRRERRQHDPQQPAVHGRV